MQPQRSMGERAVIANRDTESAEPRQKHGRCNDAPARRRIKHEANGGKNMNPHNVIKRGVIAGGRLPPWTVPWFLAEAGEDRAIGGSYDAFRRRRFRERK